MVVTSFPASFLKPVVSVIFWLSYWQLISGSAKLQKFGLDVKKNLSISGILAVL
jgi:hypothetical protein